jgi:hypothetical protein
MKSIELELESEWGNIDEVYDDFQKLLQSKAYKQKYNMV